MPPKARIIRKPSTAGASSTLKAATSGAPPPAALSSATQPLSTSSGTAMATSSKEGTMLPPPNPSPPKAVLEPELDAIAICLRNAAVKTNQIHAFFADTRRLGINNYATHPPHSLTDALGREIEKYDQLCDTVEAHLSRAIAVLQRDLDRAKAQEKAEREAEALRNRPPPEPEAVAVSNGPAEPSASSVSLVHPKDIPGPSEGGSFLAARRQSTISLSSLNRPQFPHKLDLSSAALRINPAELAQGLGGLPSPVTLAPKSGRVTATSEFPPDFMAALAASDIANRPVDIDLTMLPEEAPATAHVGLDAALGSSADRPIELDLEGMDIDMTNVDVSVDVDVKTLFGDEPTSGISTTNLFGDTTETAGGKWRQCTTIPRFPACKFQC
ncbi:hypothetical protein H4582DRAFT_1805408 [Lactarius indigo]|nr:hypothetical protein H4582DRAFT_1805408 [Lactarius indigo]